MKSSNFSNIFSRKGKLWKNFGRCKERLPRKTKSSKRESIKNKEQNYDRSVVNTFGIVDGIELLQYSTLKITTIFNIKTVRKSIR